MGDEKIIELKNITHSFCDRKILNNFSMSINIGGKYIFSAPSGYGKSTIFNMIMGFIKPDNGTVIVDGITITDNNAHEVRNKISYLPQNISLPNISVEEFVIEVSNFGQNDFSNNIFEDYINEFDLPKDILGSRLHSLSGGEKQRLMLCICLALDKRILLIDEGITGVDNERAKKILSLLSKDIELTIIYISHDITHAKSSGFEILEVM